MTRLLAKLESRKQKEKELKEAVRFQAKIDACASDIEAEGRRAEAATKETKRRMRAFKGELTVELDRLEEKKVTVSEMKVALLGIKMQRQSAEASLGETLESWKRTPGYRSEADVAALQKEVDEIASMASAFKSVTAAADDEDCSDDGGVGESLF